MPIRQERPMTHSILGLILPGHSPPRWHARRIFRRQMLGQFAHLIDRRGALPSATREWCLPCRRHKETFIMGKYFLGWLLGIPVVVLAVLWFFFG
jgi:hypothetical protein